MDLALAGFAIGDRKSLVGWVDAGNPTSPLLKSNPSRPTKLTSSILPRRWHHQCDR
jgi:hypothetical protein